MIRVKCASSWSLKSSSMSPMLRPLLLNNASKSLPTAHEVIPETTPDAKLFPILCQENPSLRPSSKADSAFPFGISSPPHPGFPYMDPAPVQTRPERDDMMPVACVYLASVKWGVVIAPGPDGFPRVFNQCKGDLQNRTST